MLSIQFLGIGEITTTIALEGALDHRHPRTGRRVTWAYKRLPSFPSVAEAQAFQQLFADYQEALQEAGIRLLFQRARLILSQGKIWVYICQERLPSSVIASKVIGPAPIVECRKIFQRALIELLKVYTWNRDHPDRLLGFDGQIPNWAVLDSGPLAYFDTSTPLVRRDGRELLNTEIFLKAIPILLRPVVRAFLLQGILDRYYQARLVLLDLIASFYTFRRPDLVPALIEDANRFMQECMADFKLAPFTVKEIWSYHRSDLLLWKFLRAMKRLDRFISEELLGRPYEQRLPKDRKLEQEIRGSR